ncbi:hypothetical protein HOA59_01665 [archaeon]|jgi:hypothetical protein|nr:hypothetical protein [archaeon]MBT6824123.1 hypothetical protein [archaeon]MBT7107032.1 hypothetical protein [archaeon]MBT7297644.1 hypothetical protein [archaeon]
MLNQKENVKKVPVNEVAEMKKSGLTNEQIIGRLKDKAYTHEQISGAIDQTNIKQEAISTNPGMGIPSQTPMAPPETRGVPLGLASAPSPTPSTQEAPIQLPQENLMPSTQQTMAPQAQPIERASYEMVEEIAESVVKEKWDELLQNIGDIHKWKEKTNTDVHSIKQEVLRTQQRFDNLQTAVMGKVNEYGEGIKDVGAEMQAIEKVLEKIIAPMTRNIKELSKITEELKKKK